MRYRNKRVLCGLVTVIAAIHGALEGGTELHRILGRNSVLQWLDILLPIVFEKLGIGVPVQSMQKVPISCACKINALER